MSAPDKSVRSRSAYRRTSTALLSTYILLKPFYFWSSGLPQVADLVLLPLIGLMVLQPSKGERDLGRAPLLLASLAIYATVVNLSAMILTNGSAQFLQSSLFIIYNCSAAIALALLHLDLGELIRETLVKSTVASAGLQTALLLMSESGSLRLTGQFNNPNQLAYFGLLSASLLIYCFYVDRRRGWLSLFGVGAAGFLVLSSLSKAGIVSVGLLIAAYLALVSQHSQGRTKLFGSAATLLIAAASLVAARSDLLANFPLFQRVGARFSDRGSDDSLSGRGYDRIGSHPEHWILGAGEGDYARLGENIELHSTLGTLFSSYGLIGLLLFSWVALVAFRRSGTIALVIYGSMLLYGLTHNGLRNTMMWILIGMMISYAEDSDIGTRSVGSGRAGYPRSKRNV